MRFTAPLPRLLPCLLALTAPLAHAAPTALGLDSSLNLLVLGNLNASSSDVQGKVAVGGNASINSYSIDTKGSGALYAGTGLTVGGNLSFNSGSVWADTRVGGNLATSWGGSYQGGSLYVGGNLDERGGLSLSSGQSATSWGTIQQGAWMPTIQTGSGSFDLGFDFSGEASRLTALSGVLAGTAATGTVSNQWGTIVLDAHGASIAIFNLDATQAGMNMDLRDLGADGTAIINIAGSAVNFGTHGYTGFDPKRVLFNLADATSVSLGYVEGSLLATQATVGAGYGVVNGQVVVNNWNSSVQVNDAAFSGTLPEEAPLLLPPIAADGVMSMSVPEPASGALLLAGLAAAFMRRRRV